MDFEDLFAEDEGLPEIPISEAHYWKEIQALVLTAFARVAVQLGPEEQISQMIQTKLQTNPLATKMTVDQRLSAWRFAQAILRLSYRPPWKESL